MRKILALTLLLAVVSILACGDSNSENRPEQLQNPGDTPTEAYKRLYAAVKSKNTDAISGEMSTKTQEFAAAVAAQQKKTVEELLENGFSATTFSPTLPEIRDERVKDNMGAVEVWNSKDNRWEDLPFIRETDGWKLAVGDLFAGSYNSPGKGLDIRQREASNANSGSNGTQMVPYGQGANTNINANANNPAKRK